MSTLKVDHKPDTQDHRLDVTRKKKQKKKQNLYFVNRQNLIAHKS